ADVDWDTLESTYLLESKRLQIIAPYMNYTFIINPLIINAGTRYDTNSEFGSEPSYSAGIVYIIDSNSDTRLKADVSTAFNAPPLLWKYYEESLSFITINPDIKPETALVYELGLESKPFEKLTLMSRGYQAKVKDAIAIALNDQNKFFMKNFEKFKRQGVEVQSNLDIGWGAGVFGAAAFNEVINETTGEEVKGGSKPVESYNAGINYANKSGLEVAVRGYYDDWNEPASNEPNDKKFLFDLKLIQRLKNISIFLNVFNIGNSSMWADVYFPVKQRYFEGGLSLAW
ncbi:MAG: TonB-dependent receptor, partial [bacterium]